MGFILGCIGLSCGSTTLWSSSQFDVPEVSAKFLSSRLEMTQNKERDRTGSRNPSCDRYGAWSQPALRWRRSVPTDLFTIGLLPRLAVTYLCSGTVEAIAADAPVTSGVRYWLTDLQTPAFANM